MEVPKLADGLLRIQAKGCASWLEIVAALPWALGGRLDDGDDAIHGRMNVELENDLW